MTPVTALKSRGQMIPDIVCCRHRERTFIIRFQSSRSKFTLMGMLNLLYLLSIHAIKGRDTVSLVVG